MNLASDLISIQGIFLSLRKEIGDFRDIKHAGGNEKSIIRIIGEFEKFFISKHYIKDNAINTCFKEKLDEIVLLLILNTQIQSDLNLNEHLHLTNIMPSLSKCVLANLIIGLDLNENYCKILESLNMELCAELLVELYPCLKKVNSITSLKNSSIIVRMVINKLHKATTDESNAYDRLTSLTSAILLNLTGITVEERQNHQLDSIYIHLGRTISVILTLLLECDLNNLQVFPIVDKLLQTCWSLMMNVTLDIFCIWAETEENDETLQNEVALKSHLVIEKYQKYKPATDLIGIISTIARKPKSVEELIQVADENTIIAMVHKKNANQKEWFQALMNTQILKNPASIECVYTWSNLCTKDDLLFLLTASTTIHTPETSKLVVRCATHLNLDDLYLILIRHFYKNGINHILNENVHLQLTIILNKLKNTNLDDNLLKELHLLLLQNPKQFLTIIFDECLKNMFYTHTLKAFLVQLKQVLSVGNIGLKIIKQQINIHKPDDNNLKSIIELFNLLITEKIYSNFVIFKNILIPELKIALQESHHKQLSVLLEIWKKMDESMSLNSETEPFFIVLFDTMIACRCKFLEFDRLQHEIVKNCVDIVFKYKKEIGSTYKPENISKEDLFVSYYVQKLCERPESIPTFLQHYFPNLDFNNHAEIVTNLIRIIPLCVTSEWIEICAGLIIIIEPSKTVEAFTDSLLLLCQLINSQDTKEIVDRMLNGMRCCLQNLGTLIIDKIPSDNQEEQIILAYNICRLVQQIPQDIKQEGLSLINLISDDTFKLLKNDKKFALLVASIKDEHIIKFLVKKLC